MKTKRFFELFGSYTFWKPGEIGHEGFSVEDLYKQFKKRIQEEKNERMDKNV